MLLCTACVQHQKLHGQTKFLPVYIAVHSATHVDSANKLSVVPTTPSPFPHPFLKLLSMPSLCNSYIPMHHSSTSLFAASPSGGSPPCSPPSWKTAQTPQVLRWHTHTRPAVHAFPLQHLFTRIQTPLSCRLRTCSKPTRGRSTSQSPIMGDRPRPSRQPSSIPPNGLLSMPSMASTAVSMKSIKGVERQASLARHRKRLSWAQRLLLFKPKPLGETACCAMQHHAVLCCASVSHAVLCCPPSSKMEVKFLVF